MTHDEMMSLLANTLADAAGHAGCLPILDCFSPHPGEEVTVSIPMCDDTVDIVLEDLGFPHEWEELLENSGADTMGDLVDYLCYCSQKNISLAISPEDEEKLYARPSRPPPRRGTWYGQVGQRPQTKHQVPQYQRPQRKLHFDRECTLQHRQPRA